MGRFAVFVDAGYFWVQTISSVLGKPRGARTDVSIDFTKLHANLLLQVSTVCNHADILRVYWYDGPGQQGKASDHRSIEELDDFKLRLGTRNSMGQQKAVDGLIIADILSLAQSKAIETAFLISGDADLAPGVIAAQALGLRVHLGILEPVSSTSPYLAAESDTKFYFPSNWVQSFAKPASTPGIAVPAIIVPTDMAATASVQPLTPNSHPAAWINLIATQVLSNLKSFPHAALLAGITKGRVPLPQEVDSQLLFAGRNEIGRALTEDEKRTLRSTFKGLIP